MPKRILTLPGDGIGPEIMACATAMLETLSRVYALDLDIVSGLVGGSSIDANGCPLTDETLSMAKRADAVLLGAVGGPCWDHLKGVSRPEAGLLTLRKGLDLYQNLRPVIPHPTLFPMSPLKNDRLEGVDFVVVRELTSDVYYGAKGRVRFPDEWMAFDLMSYTDVEIGRIAKDAFELAKKRRNRLTLVDKANVLESSRLWREVVSEIHSQYQEVTLDHLYVDNAAMQLMLDPKQFDVLLTANLFGDILSDQASALTGSIGLMPSASLGHGRKGLYEPIHGSAPSLAGMDKANPAGMLLSVAMMFRHSFDRRDIAEHIEACVWATVESGYGTDDLAGVRRIPVGTQGFTEQVIGRLHHKGIALESHTLKEVGQWA